VRYLQQAESSRETVQQWKNSCSETRSRGTLFNVLYILILKLLVLTWYQKTDKLINMRHYLVHPGPPFYGPDTLAGAHM